MPKRLLLALIVLVAAPMVLLGWMSATTLRQRESDARNRIDELFQSELARATNTIRSRLDQYKQHFQQTLAAAGGNLEPLQSLGQTDPIVRTVMIVDKRGGMIFPPPPLIRTDAQAVAYAALQAIVRSRPSLLAEIQAKKKVENPVIGQWQVWYRDEGLQLIYWQAGPTASTSFGVLLERSRWISDLTEILPDSVSQRASPSSGFTALVDEQSKVIYRWGDRSDRREQPIAARALPEPIANWKLEFHADDPIPAFSVLPSVLSLAGLGLMLLILGGYVLTSVRRKIREAQSRVSFASQVSHELRTPLTNIRLYAELAENDLQTLPDNETKQDLHKRLEVINTESQRLSRLVSGVLEVIRDQGQSRPPRLNSVIPDEVIDQTLQQFEPSFAARGIQIQRVASAQQSMPLDADMLEMILVNLLSNVEKYASEGGYVRLESTLSPTHLNVVVADRGPGIAMRHRQWVFQPFNRLDDSISAPSGTGMGLSIARQLAQRHGGTLILIKSNSGATFELRIPVQDSENSDRESNLLSGG